ncbi:MAG: DUF4394 domain-containing protein [Pyrinomonadaceae bacterium]
MHLITFNAATPGTVSSDVAITGLGGGEIIVGIDVRPSTGELYAFGLAGSGGPRTGRLLKLNPTTGALTLVGAASFSTTLADTEYCGFDFNPVTDEIRVTNRSQQNMRVNPTTGALIATDTNLSISGINDIAYDRNTSGGSATTLFAYDFSNDIVGRIGGVDGSPSPNGGVFTAVGSSGQLLLDAVYFDIDAAGNARLVDKGKLYSVNLSTGAATLQGTIGSGPNFRGMTSAPPDPASFTGTAGSDTISIVRSGANVVGTGVSGGTVTIPLASLTQIDVDGLGGADTITVDFSGGGFGIPVNVNGGAPSTSPGDRLITKGGNFGIGLSIPTNGHDGQLQYAGGSTGLSSIFYTGLEPIDELNVVTDFDISATNGLNFINIVNGPVVLGTQTTQVNDGAVLFELVNFANKTNVTINALDGSDQIAINNSLKGVGLTSLTVNAGNGDDQFNINGPGIVSGTSYTFNGESDNDFFSVSGGLLGGPITVNGGIHTGGTPSTSDRLTVNAAASNVTNTGTQLQFSGGGAISYNTLEQINLNNLNTLSDSGTGGADSYLLTKPTASEFRSIVNGGTEVNFTNPVAVVGGQYFANPSGGGDTLTIDNTGRIVNLRVAYNASTGTDFLNVFGNPGSPIARESFIAATSDAGRLVVDPDGNLGFLKTTVAAANGDELDVSFNGLEPVITDVPSTIFDFCMSASIDNASIAADGTLVNGAQSALVFSGSSTFNNTRFTNKGTATFSGFTSPDGMVYSVTALAPAGLTNVEFYGFLPPGLGVDDAPGSLSNVDFVSIGESTNAARTPMFTYSSVTPSVVDITGLPQTMRVGTAELLGYVGTPANNDVATVVDNTAAVNPAHVTGLLTEGAFYKRNGGVGFGGELGPDMSFHGLGGTPFPLILDGNDPSTIPGDRLVYDGPVPFTNTPTGPAAGDITAAGVIGVRYARYEKVQGVKDSSTTLVSSGSPTFFGAPVTFTATVTPALPGVVPTGTVNFNDGANPIGSCQNVALNGSGVAACTVSTLSVGVHPVTAVYSGSANHNPSTSNVLNHVVIKANTITTITADTPDPSVVGQNYTVTVAVAPVAPGAGTPTGNFLVSDGTNACSIILPATSCQLTSFTAGAKTLTATYSGDGNFNGSVSATAPHTVNPANTATAVQTSINAPNYGSTLTATATVVAVAPGGGVPQGTVNFNDGGFAIAGCQNVALNALGAAVCTSTQLPAGVGKVVQAVYAGNANYNGSNGSATQTIGKAPLNVQASSHTVTYGDAAPVVTSTITGFVLGETSAVLGTQPSCSTTYTQGSPVSGSQYPTSCSGGVSNNYSLNYLNGTVTVNKKALTVTADAKTRAYGAANPALTATLSGFIGADNAGNSTTGTAGLSTTATATSPVGNYPITVTVGTLQSGNYSFATLTNGVLSVTAAQLTVTADNQSRVFGAANPALTFQITGFQNGDGPAVVTGTPNVSTTANASSSPGTYPISVAQGTLASPNYTFATANGTLTVTIASTTTTITNITALGTPTQVGQSYAVNWSVTPVAPGAGTPLGQVVVNDGVGAGSTFCTALVSAGTCSLTSTTSGAKTITVTYGGDTNFTGSSATTSHTVVNGLTGNVKQFIAFGTNTNLAGVTMTLLNTGTQQAVTTTTDANGNYSFSTALGQSYTITPSGLGKAFEATSRTYTNVAGNISGADFIAYDVPGPNAIPRSARVSSQIATQGQPVTVPVLITTTGVETKVSFSVEYPTGPLGVPTVTCGTGAVNCTLTVDNSLAGKTGITVTPFNSNPIPAGTRELVKITFPTQSNPATSAAIKFGDFPTAKDVRNAENNPLPMLYWTDGLVSFTGGTLLDGATISGRVTTSAGQGLRNATVTLIDTAGGRRTTITSSFGNYQFENLELGRDYMLVVTSKRFRFPTRIVTLDGNLTDVVLVGLE